MMRGRVVVEVARRDFLSRGKSKVFLIGTLAIMALILGGVPLLAGAIQEEGARPVGVVGPAVAGFDEALAAASQALETDLEIVPFDSRSEAEAALEEGDVDAVVAEREIIYYQRESGPVQAVLGTAFGTIDRRAAASQLGLSPDDVAALLAPAPPDVVLLAAPDEDQDVRAGAAYLGVVLLFVAIVMFGQFVLLGVLEEKANRVAEVVLSRVRPVELLAGKVIGVGLLGLIQLLAIGGTLVFVLGRIDIADLPTLSEISTGIFLSVVMWFLLGYALYSVLFAAAGALISRQEDVQSVSWIPILAIMPGYVIALVASTDPTTSLVEIASMVPLTAPMVMLVRSAALDVPFWQLATSIATTVVTTYILIRIAARVYRGGILRSGRTKLREAWRQATI